MRAPSRIEAVERHRLALRPERRALLLTRVATPAARRLAVANMHLSVPSTGQGHDEVLRAAELAVAFAGGDPLILGGDLNLRPSQHAAAFEELERRFGLAAPTGPKAIDHLLVRGLDRGREAARRAGDRDGRGRCASPTTLPSRPRSA